MSKSAIDTLLRISSNPIGEELLEQSEFFNMGGLLPELFSLLANKNGFYAFTSALLIRSSGNCGKPASIEKWNERSLWLEKYEMLMRPMTFFAEDVFGCQFAICDDRIVSFEPETGAIRDIADSIETWTYTILEKYKYWTGCSIAYEWQKVHGKLKPGNRLLPKQPFVLGGDYMVENLIEKEEVESMLIRAGFASAIRDIPDGTDIEFKWTE
jgi:hypothetical protein